jgi:hypothetical protein
MTTATLSAGPIHPDDMDRLHEEIVEDAVYWLGENFSVDLHGNGAEQRVSLSYRSEAPLQALKPISSLLLDCYVEATGGEPGWLHFEVDR